VEEGRQKNIELLNTLKSMPKTDVPLSVYKKRINSLIDAVREKHNLIVTNEKMLKEVLQNEKEADDECNKELDMLMNKLKEKSESLKELHRKNKQQDDLSMVHNVMESIIFLSLNKIF
jgi:DNA repair exonuclease SbcCD ATPase subunit